MGFIKNWKVQTKILGLVCLLVLGIIGLGIYNNSIIRQVGNGGTYIFENNLRSSQYALTAQTAFANLSATTYLHILATTSAEFREYEETLASELEKLNKALALYQPLIDTPEERELLQNINTAVKRYSEYLPVVTGLSQSLQKEEALQIIEENVREIRRTAMAELDELAAYNITLAEEQDHQNDTYIAAASYNSIIIIILLAILNTALGLWIARLITKPIIEVEQVAEALAAGDLSQTTRYTSQDEIGRMATAINKAVTNLRNLVGSVVEVAEEVSASSEELASASQEVGLATTQIAETINQLAKGADQEARDSQEMSEEIQNVADSTENVSAAAQQMAADADATVTAADQGWTLVKQAVTQMTAIQETVNNSAGTVADLGERSREIGQIVDVITGIADQTNLLALNAAIEAARAGEQGRGFAVVAEEVRKLAEESRQAAEEISTLIKEIQSQTATAVEEMTAGTEQVATGTTVINETGQAFQDIIHKLQGVSAQIQQVAAATEGLVHAGEKIAKDVESIAATAEESAAASQEISASSQEQSASVEEIAASAESLAEIAQSLLDTVGTFQL